MYLLNLMPRVYSVEGHSILQQFIFVSATERLRVFPNVHVGDFPNFEH
jgi:hypothetical protein